MLYCGGENYRTILILLMAMSSFAAHNSATSIQSLKVLQQHKTDNLKKNSCRVSGRDHQTMDDTRVMFPVSGCALLHKHVPSPRGSLTAKKRR